MWDLVVKTQYDIRTCDMIDYMKSINIYNRNLEQLINQEPIGFDSVLNMNLPNKSGIYAIFEKNNDVCVYISESKNIRKRVYKDLFHANESSV